jgi:hypothetical protein
MLSLRIKRSLNTDTDVDPKQLLRAQVEQWPVEMQREFVAAAYQLLADRIDLSKVEMVTNQKHMS